MRRRRPSLAILVLLSLMLQLVLVPSPAGYALAHPGHEHSEPSAAAGGPGPLAPRAQWVEDESKRTAYAKQFNVGDQMVAEFHVAPIHKQDSAGKWVDIDNNLVADGHGNLDADLGRFKVGFSAHEQKNRMHIDLSGGRILEMGLDEALPESVGGAPKQAAFDALAALPGKMRYKEKRGLVDYAYDVDGQQVKETITLRKWAGKSEFIFPLDLTGLTLRDDGAGAFSLLDADSGEVQAKIPPAFAQDAAGIAAPDVTQTLVTLAGGKALRVAVDAAWLAAPERKYPWWSTPVSSSRRRVLTWWPLPSVATREHHQIS